MPYWSRSAFRLGENQVMRYFVEPCSKVNPIAYTGNNYLKRELITQMEKRDDFCYRMFVQLQTDPRKEPIEDHTKEWKSMALEVATIKLEGGSPLPDEQCHGLVFTPWNRHKAHEPLGNFNRARYHIYKEAAKFRFKK